MTILNNQLTQFLKFNNSLLWAGTCQLPRTTGLEENKSVEDNKQLCHPSESRLLSGLRNTGLGRIHFLSACTSSLNTSPFSRPAAQAGEPRAPDFSHVLEFLCHHRRVLLIALFPLLQEGNPFIWTLRTLSPALPPCPRPFTVLLHPGQLPESPSHNTNLGYCPLIIQWHLILFWIKM